jgi:hypothetical protein
VGAKIMLFIEPTKLFEGKSLFDRQKEKKPWFHSASASLIFANSSSRFVSLVP